MAQQSCFHEELSGLRDCLWAADSDNNAQRSSLRRKIFSEHRYTRKEFDRKLEMDSQASPAGNSSSSSGADRRLAAESIPLPATVKIMDLSNLSLTGLSIHQTIFVREEYHIVKEIIDATGDFGRGSVLVSGQSGIGKSYFLYYILVDRLLRGENTYFQSTGTLYFLSGNGVHVVLHARPHNFVRTDPDWALVDATIYGLQPHPHLIHADIKIVMASSPGQNSDRKWLDRVNGRCLAMMPWSWQELFVAGHFLHPVVLDAKLLQKAVHYFGHSPRQCFLAGQTQAHFDDAWDVVLSLTTSIQGMAAPIYSGMHHAGEASHTIYEVYPQNSRRSLHGAQIKAASIPILREIMKRLAINKGKEIADLFRTSSHIAHAAPLAGRFWEAAVHNYLAKHKGPFSPTPLQEDLAPLEFITSTTSIVENGGVFANKTDLEELLIQHLSTQTSCYLTPASSSFAGIDAIAVQANGTLVFIQATTAKEHDIKVAGLQAVQWCLKPSNAMLKQHRPSKQRPWKIVFVVPHVPGVDFDQRQKLRDSKGVSTAWMDKTEQYALTLDIDRTFMAHPLPV